MREKSNKHEVKPDGSKRRRNYYQDIAGAMIENFKQGKPPLATNKWSNTKWQR